MDTHTSCQSNIRSVKQSCCRHIGALTKRFPSHRPRVIRSLISSLTLCIVTACVTVPTKEPPAVVKTFDEAASVHVSALPAIPWADIAGSLTVKNNLTIDQCRQLAINTTRADTLQTLSVFSAALGLGLPEKSTSTSSSRASSDSPSVTHSSTKSTGTIPSLPGTHASLPELPTPDVTSQPLAMGTDGNTVIWGGTSLCEQANILDNIISKSAFPPGYRLHLITLQINIQPKLRNLSYDTDVTVALIPRSVSDVDWTSGLEEPGVIVYPLILTDAIEQSNVGRSQAALQQAILQLSGVIGEVGANFGTENGAAWLKSVLGFDKNSLMTMGVAKPNTLHIRIGAQNSGSTAVAMVPRSYNVSLAVMTRMGINGLTAMATPRLRAASSIVTKAGGAPMLVQQRHRCSLASPVKNMLDQFGFSLKTLASNDIPTDGSSDDRSNECKNSKLTNRQIDDYLNIYRAIDYQDMGYLNNHLEMKMQDSGNGVALNQLDEMDFIKLQRLIGKFADLQIQQATASAWIPFRKIKPITNDSLPAHNQIVSFIDDKKAESIAILRGAQNIDASTKVEALLHVKRAQGANMTMAPGVVLLSTASTVSNSGSEIDIKFPSLHNLQLTTDGQSPLCLTKFGEPWQWQWGHAGTFPRPDDDRVKAIVVRQCFAIAQLQEAPNSPNNPLSAATSVVDTDGINPSGLILSVGQYRLSDSKQSLVMFVSGADAQYKSGANLIPIPPTGAPLAPMSNVVLQLTNLSPSSPIILTTKLSTPNPKAPKSPILSSYGAPLSLRVERTVQMRN